MFRFLALFLIALIGCKEGVILRRPQPYKVNGLHYAWVCCEGYENVICLDVHYADGTVSDDGRDSSKPPRKIPLRITPGVFDKVYPPKAVKAYQEGRNW